MKGRRVLAALLMVLAVIATGQAEARSLPKGGVTIAEMAALMEKDGYPVEVADIDGGQRLDSERDGVRFGVYFYDCDDKGRCQDVQYAAAWDLDEGMSLSRINTWNRENRFGRGYLDDEGDPWVEMDVGLRNGANHDQVLYSLEVWRLVMNRFADYAADGPTSP